MRLLIVEEDPGLAARMREGLRRHGFRSDPADGLQEADNALHVVRYDAVLLDLDLPDGGGLDWLRRKQTDPLRPPVLVLTERGALESRITGLDAGADDYVVKPCELDEVAARLRALLRRTGPRSPPVIHVGPLAFDLATRTARVGDEPLELTRRETDLLELLMRRAGSVLPKALIEDTLYAFDEPVTPNAIEAVVSRLRHRLENAGEHDRLITVRSVGYLLKDGRA